MGLLDDTAIFAAVVSQGGFSHAAKYLGLSNGLISRRIARLEATMGVSLIIRTTRHIKLTPEGELFWQYAKRIQQELNNALGVIQSLSSKPKGNIRISAPYYVGRYYLMPLLLQFLNNFKDISIELILSNQRLDPVKHKIDLLIRSSGYLHTPTKENSFHMKPLAKKSIGLYASADYLLKNGTPKTPLDLLQHKIIGYIDQLNLPATLTWEYLRHGKQQAIEIQPAFKCNDIEASLSACVAGYGIGKYSAFVVNTSAEAHNLTPVLTDYLWGELSIYALYAAQQSLPKRTRLLLDFIASHMMHR